MLLANLELPYGVFTIAGERGGFILSGIDQAFQNDHIRLVFISAAVTLNVLHTLRRLHYVRLIVSFTGTPSPGSANTPNTRITASRKSALGREWVKGKKQGRSAVNTRKDLLEPFN